MHCGILKLKLSTFRSYRDLSLELELNKPVVIIGRNGAGKTNLLEAVSFLAPGRGLRGAKGSDLCMAGEKSWAVYADVIHDNLTIGIGTGKCETDVHRQIKISGKKINQQKDLSRYLSVLWLTPAMDRLFCAEPVSRRRFMDRLVGAYDSEHLNLVSQYQTMWRSWLLMCRQGQRDEVWLRSVEKNIASLSVAISANRVDIVERLGQILKAKNTDNFPSARISLSGFLEQKIQEKSAGEVEVEYQNFLKQNRKNVANGQNIPSVSSSDFSVINTLNNLPAHVCSTGEQKALLISIILSQCQLIGIEKGKYPILLLDELTAHLDEVRTRQVFEKIKDYPSQVWISGLTKADFCGLPVKQEIIL